MAEENNGPAGSLFGGHEGRERQDKVLRFMARRLKKGANLQDVKNEEYVQRNVSQAELNRILRDPRLVEASRQGVEEDLEEAPDPER